MVATPVTEYAIFSGILALVAVLVWLVVLLLSADWGDPD